jgi:membrane associated rhomboid family serine protease
VRPGRSGELLTLGGRVPPGVGGLILAILGSSLLAQFSRTLGDWGVLLPPAVREGELWRLVTWTFLSGSPLELIFTTLMLIWFGRDLAWAWGTRRLLLTWLGFGAASAAAVVLLSLVDPGLDRAAFAGPSPPMAALIVAWGLLYPERHLSFWGVLPLTGMQLVWITIGGTLFFGAFGGLRSVVPDLAAELLMLLWFRGLSPRGAWQSFRMWLGQRRMRRRAQHLRVVKKNGKGDPPQWLN